MRWVLRTRARHCTTTATDVCKALGVYVNAAGKPNVTMALKKLKPHQIGSNRIEAKARSGSTRAQDVKMISEGGLYKLIMRSNKPDAIAFQNWVAREVLSATAFQVPP